MSSNGAPAGSPVAIGLPTDFDQGWHLLESEAIGALAFLFATFHCFRDAVLKLNSLERTLVSSQFSNANIPELA